jgi:hypothetical protein
MVHYASRMRPRNFRSLRLAAYLTAQELHASFVTMTTITIDIAADLLARARQYADEHGTTLEALIAEHLAFLADRTGRRLTAREQIYVDCPLPRRLKNSCALLFSAKGLGARGPRSRPRTHPSPRHGRLCSQDVIGVKSSPVTGAFRRDE